MAVCLSWCSRLGLLGRGVSTAEAYMSTWRAASTAVVAVAGMSHICVSSSDARSYIVSPNSRTMACLTRMLNEHMRSKNVHVSRWYPWVYSPYLCPHSTPVTFRMTMHLSCFLLVCTMVVVVGDTMGPFREGEGDHGQQAVTHDVGRRSEGMEAPPRVQEGQRRGSQPRYRRGQGGEKMKSKSPI